MLKLTQNVVKWVKEQFKSSREEPRDKQLQTYSVSEEEKFYQDFKNTLNFYGSIITMLTM